MKIGILGANGALGSQLVKAFKHHDLVPVYRHKLRIRDDEFSQDGYGPYEIDEILKRGGDFVDMSSPLGTMDVCDNSMEDLFRRHDFDVVVNAVAYNDTNKADEQVYQCFDLNTVAVMKLVNLCNAHNTLLIHISTDYVMGGESLPNDFWENGIKENHPPSPKNVYAISKYAGEQIVANYCKSYSIVRVSALFGKVGSSAKGGMNFPYTILKKVRDNELPIECVNDQLVLPGYTLDVARQIEFLVRSKIVDPLWLDTNLFHITNTGTPVSWYQIAKTVVGYVRSDKFVKENVIPVRSERFYSTTPRSHYTALTTNKKSLQLRHWKEALRDFFKEIQLTEEINLTFLGEENESCE